MRPHAVGTGGGAVGRRKAGAAAAAASRDWMVVPASGPARVEEAGKHAVMARTGLPARDLRVLDSLLSYPSTILGRERAIVVNLERVKAVITAAEVLLPNSKDPAFARFVRDLQARVLASSSDQVLFFCPGTSLALSMETLLRFRIRKSLYKGSNVCEWNCAICYARFKLECILCNPCEFCVVGGGAWERMN
jgi:hypothetical protein